MKLVLQLKEARADAAAVSGVVRVDDQREADAPARALDAHRFGPLTLPAGATSFTVALPDEALPAGASLNVRVEVRGADGRVTRFLNTTAIPVPEAKAAALSADLDRI